MNDRGAGADDAANMSRRSSDTSADDDRSRGESVGLSLEYDDISLDLISDSARETERRILALIPDLDTDPKGCSPAEHVGEDVEGDIATADREAPPWRRLDELDQLLPYEMITDLGRRSGCDYDTRSTPGKGDVFVQRNPPQVPRTPAAVDPKISRSCSESIRGFFATAHNPLPGKPTCAERIAYALRCPPHGRIGRVLTLAIGVVLVWGTIWSISGREALPGGNLFALIVLTLGGYVAGMLVQTVNLPPILGMLTVGCLLGNVHAVNVAKDIDREWSRALRNVALAVVLLRAGLGLDTKSLTAGLSFRVVRLAFLPSTCEAGAVAVASHFLLGFPWTWGFLLGCILSASAPAVVVPGMLKLQREGFGTAKGVPSLLMASTAVEPVLSRTAFVVLLGHVFLRPESLAETLLHGPAEAAGSAAVAAVCGLALWYFPERHQRYAGVLRCLLLLCCGLVAVFLGRAVDCRGPGPTVACVVVAAVAAVRWRKYAWNDHSALAGEVTAALWKVCEPLLFGLLGTRIDVGLLTGFVLGPGMMVVFIGLVVRIVASFTSMLCTELSCKERFFVSFAWLPKATVQITTATAALSMTTADDLLHELALQVAAIAMLSGVVVGPVGAALSAVSGPRLLTKSKPLKKECSSGQFTRTSWYEQMSTTTSVRTADRVEITTERETVT